MANPLSDLFKKKPQTVPADSEETVVQDSVRGSSGSAYESRAPLDSTVMASSIEDAEEAPASSEDIFAIPVLGTRTAAQHQRILSFALVASFIVLAVATTASPWAPFPAWWTARTRTPKSFSGSRKP